MAVHPREPLLQHATDVVEDRPESATGQRETGQGEAGSDPVQGRTLVDKCTKRGAHKNSRSQRAALRLVMEHDHLLRTTRGQLAAKVAGLHDMVAAAAALPLS